MRKPCSISGVTFNSTSSVYKRLYDMPSSKAVRAVEAAFMRSIMENSSNRITEVLSIGAGRADLYKSLMKKYFTDGKMRLLAIESDDFLASIARDEFPGEYMDAIAPNVVEDGHSCIFTVKNYFEIDFRQKYFDFIEINFVLSSFLFSEDIRKFLRKIVSYLKDGGALIISDTDCYIGSYIESRVTAFSRFFKDIQIDVDQGFISGQKQRKHELPLLDINNVFADREMLMQLYRDRFEAFAKEGLTSQLPEAQSIVNHELDDIRRGMRFYRPKDEWKNILTEVMGETADIIAMGPEDIKKKHPDVLDFPFILIATKK